MGKAGLFILLLMWQVSASSLTLEEYGVTLTDTGLVDHVSGLRWLDSSLTQGGYDQLQPLLESGWSFASEEELYYLLTRSDGSFSGATVLGEDGLLHIADQLSFGFGLEFEFTGPWVCRSYGDPEQYCTTLNTQGSIAGLGGQFTLEMGDAFMDGGTQQIPIFMYPYVTEVPIYGSLACYEQPDLPCIGEGRSLLVRAVPLPASIMLMLSALGILGVKTKRAGQ